MKNRVTVAVNRYGLKELQRDGDLFEGSGRVHLNQYVQCLPEATQDATLRELDLLDSLRDHIDALEKQIENRIGNRDEMRLLRTLRGVGPILGATLFLETGEIDRFPSAARLASYAGLVPIVHSSGGKT